MFDALRDIGSWVMGAKVFEFILLMALALILSVINLVLTIIERFKNKKQEDEEE